MRIFLTGGCGYVGSVLTGNLLKAGHDVTVFDAQWFGNFLKDDPRLTVIKGDIRSYESFSLRGFDCVFHLANVANDPCVDLDPTLSWEVNGLATMQLADKAAREGVKQFVFASSGSVYGISDEPKVTEDLPLHPISAYNKTKMVAERVILSYKDSMAVQIVRPGTVCGLSPRMRLDLLVNMLTMQALKNGKITVLGGAQSRPTIHIDDMCGTYMFLLANPNVTGVFNASFENITVQEVAEAVVRHVPADVSVAPSNDPRSYRMCSDKLLAAGYVPSKSAEHAIRELADAYGSGALRDDDQYYNIKWMKLHPPVFA